MRKVPARPARPGTGAARTVEIRAEIHWQAGPGNTAGLAASILCKMRSVENAPVENGWRNRPCAAWSASENKVPPRPESRHRHSFARPGEFQNGTPPSPQPFPLSAESKVAFMRRSYCFARTGGSRDSRPGRNPKSGTIPILGIAWTRGNGCGLAPRPRPCALGAAARKLLPTADGS